MTSAYPSCTPSTRAGLSALTVAQASSGTYKNIYISENGYEGDYFFDPASTDPADGVRVLLTADGPGVAGRWRLGTSRFLIEEGKQRTIVKATLTSSAFPSGDPFHAEFLTKNNPYIPRPVVIYCHGAGQNQDTCFNQQVVYPGGSTTSYDVASVMKLLIEDGCVVAACYAGGNLWGNAAAQTAIATLYNYLVNNWNISKVILFGESMGNVAALNIASARSIPVVAYVGTDFICNLANIWSQGGVHTEAIRTAYGIAADGSDYAAKTAGFDPLLQTPSTYNGVDFFLTASPNDTTAIKGYNSDAFYTSMHSSVAYIGVATATGPHGDPSHYLPLEVRNFVRRAGQQSLGNGSLSGWNNFRESSDARPVRITGDPLGLPRLDFEDLTGAVLNFAWRKSNLVSGAFSLWASNVVGGDPVSGGTELTCFGPNSFFAGAAPPCRSATVAFPGGVANQKVDLYFSGTQQFAGAMFVEVTGAFSDANATGIVAKRFALGINPAGSTYENDGAYYLVHGATPSEFAIGPVTWDATNSRWRVTISHRATNANTAKIRVSCLPYSDTMRTNFMSITAGAIYTTDSTVYPAPCLSLGNLPPTYANNAAALAGGLVAGNVYRSGLDPDLLAVVH